MHGVPPRDFPRQALTEFFELHARLGHSAQGQSQGRALYAELHRQVRGWPRTPANDPFHAASQELARHLQSALGLPVVVAFNEFCDPDLDAGFDQAAGRGAREVVALTPMLTPGGEHAEHDIPASIERARQRHPNVTFSFAWPFPPGITARFLADHVRRFREGGGALA